MSHATLPILDLSRFESGDAAVRAAFLDDLRYAAREVGFFYLRGHGVGAALIDDMQTLARRFFQLPDADKRALDMIHSPHFRGYTRAGAELTRGKPDWREQFDVGAERAAIVQGDDVPVWTRLQGPNQWPDALPELRPTVLRWQSELTDLAIRLLRAFAEALEQPADIFEAAFSGTPNQHIKIIRYPGRSATRDAQSEGRDPDNQGVGAHKDSEFLSFLLQDSQGGLQVATDSGAWIDATPLADSFVVNIGELLELATNGYLRATIHRVVSPPADRERLSIAFFLGARLDATVPLLTLPPSLSKEARGPASDPENPLFHDAGSNYLKGRLRSHPDVARRHYQDVLDGANGLPL
jgi:isopenicillin N synthase-like dioxygenase